MGRVFKPTYTKPIPLNAPVVEYDGLMGVWVETRGGVPQFSRLTKNQRGVRVQVDAWALPINRQLPTNPAGLPINRLPFRTTIPTCPVPFSGCDAPIVQVFQTQVSSRIAPRVYHESEG